jgi:hypothetical protein
MREEGMRLRGGLVKINYIRGEGLNGMCDNGEIAWRVCERGRELVDYFR